MKRNIVVDAIIDSELLEPGAVIILGLSGGPDSLCLLHALNEISDAFNYEIVPVHVNHHLRPEADAEAEHVEYICDRMNLECRMYDSDCAALAEELGISTEEAGRNIRYQIFDEVADELMDEGRAQDKIVIALAHNADDQCETVLFRLLRGTGTHGLSGIPAIRLSASGIAIVRPILSVERKDIEQYIKDNKLRPNIDKSNKDNSYTRNRIRNELIPYLEKNYNPNIRAALRRYAFLSDMDDSLLRRMAFSDYADSLATDEESKTIYLNLPEIRDNHPAINSRVVTYILSLLNLESLTSYESISSLVELIYSENPSAGVDLPLGIRAYREYDRLIFSSSDEMIRADESMEILPQIIMAKDFSPDEETPYAAFDFDEFNKEYPGMIGELRLRTRREGDYLPIKGGNKKIQDFLVDTKVKKNARDSIQMVCMGSEVLWVLPSEYFSGASDREKGRFSSKYHIKDTTDRVLFIELIETI
ncbi:MAG: tRNA lysidine(34) synthetase TilS [Mogibacterium sp.]|nr:tRNA lysidine(34) synthetase TilS [Mogibacterium sp.]